MSGRRRKGHLTLTYNRIFAMLHSYNAGIAQEVGQKEAKDEPFLLELGRDEHINLGILLRIWYPVVATMDVKES